MMVLFHNPVYNQDAIEALYCVAEHHKAWKGKQNVTIIIQEIGDPLYLLAKVCFLNTPHKNNNTIRKTVKPIAE